MSRSVVSIAGPEDAREVWGPEGFHLEVHGIDELLLSAMVADNPETVAFMQRPGLALHRASALSSRARPAFRG